MDEENIKTNKSKKSKVSKHSDRIKELYKDCDPKVNKTCDDKIKHYTKMEQILQQEYDKVEKECKNMQGLKDWNDLMKEIGVREISYRNNDMTGVHALQFLNEMERLVNVLNKYNEQAAKILKYLVPVRQFIVHSFVHKNHVKYSDYFLELLMFAIIFDDHLTDLMLLLRYKKKCE